MAPEDASLPRSRDRRAESRPGLFLALGVAALAAALYLPALRNGFVNWDDTAYVTEDPVIRSLSPAALVEQAKAVRVSIWAPMTTWSYAADYAIWRLDPFGYHLTNALLHAMTAGLFVALLLELGFSLPAAGLAAVIFAIHPVQVESVAWISQRKSVLALFFLVLSFLAYARATRTSPASGRGLALSFALFGAGLLSKVTVVVFPAVLLLYDLGYRSERFRRLLLEKGPFLAAAAAVAWVGLRFQVADEVTTPGWLGGTPWLHAGTIASLFARYARILLFPTRLSTLYDPPDARTLVEPWVIAGFAFLALGAWGARHAWRHDRRALWWMGIFWLGFLPVAQIIPYSVHLADRYVHLPSLGFAAGAGSAMAALLARIGDRPARGASRAAIAFALVCLAALTTARERVWHDSVALWRDAVEKPPVHWSSDYNYAKTMADEGDLRTAIVHYERALTKTDSIKVITNLGNAYAITGELPRAEALLRRAAYLPEGKPENRAQASGNLGVVLEALGRPQAAVSAYQQAIALDSRAVEPRVRLARILRARGRGAEARLRFEQALALDPGNAQAQIGLAGLDADAGRTEAARKRLDAILARDPGNAEGLLERARVEAKAGDPGAARADLDRALDLAPPGPLRKRIVEARDTLAEGLPAR